MDWVRRKEGGDSECLGRSPTPDRMVEEARGSSRRLFLRGSLLLGVPLMITLKSRTVLGDTNNASGNLSGCSGTMTSEDSGSEDQSQGDYQAPKKNKDKGKKK